MRKLFENILKNKENLKNKYDEKINIDSIIIEEKGKVLSKFYKQDCLHEMRSISKVLIALACGILIDRELVDLEEYIYPTLENAINLQNTSNLEKIKKWQVKHLLTYSCGYEAQMFSERFIKDIKPQDYLNYVVNYNLVNEPGERYVYNNAELFLLSVFYQEKFKENIKDFIVREIFKPLEIENYIWKNYDKYCPGGTGLYIFHKDLFKIGKLILNKGIFNNKQIISKKYIEEMCSSKIQTPYAVKPERVLPKLAVGYIMHISRDGYFYKDGTNGQYLIINFEKEQIISILSSEKDMSSVTEILRNLI